MDKPPTELLVTVDYGIIRVPIHGDANREAREIMQHGLRLWNAEKKKATFLPTHRIQMIEATWGE